MQLLIKQATVVHPHSPHHGEKVDIFIADGKISAIKNNYDEYDPPNTHIINLEGVFVSPGWLDIGVNVGDPGFEYREDLDSVAAAAMAGGFTGIAIQPNNNPVVESKSEVLYLKRNAENRLLDFLPIGAVSHNCEGKEITEMYDMFAHGAVAFSDGKKSIQDDGLMMRALQYVKVFDSIVLNHPHEKSVAFGGQMHEGGVSTSMGLKGIPSISEELLLQRDLYLAEYTDSKLHVLNVSTAGAVDMIRRAKQKGLKISASVAVMNVVFEDSDLSEFDTNLKVLPPLRENADIKALKKGLKDGTIDCICSNHTPYNKEEKDLEFLYAEFGAIGLETSFSVANSHLNKDLDLDTLVEKFAIKPREILNQTIPKIEKGEIANLTIFQPNKKWTFTEKNIFSKSRNTPFLNKELMGKVLGVVNNFQFSMNE